MTNQVYLGKEVPARKATQAEGTQIQSILTLKSEIREAYSKIEELLKELPQEEALVTWIFDPETNKEEQKTFIVGKPKGHYVTYKEVDLVMNSKTTKKLLKELEG